MKTKNRVGCALALAMIASLTTPIQAANSGWAVNESGIWNYTKEDGTLAKGWQTIDGCWYAFEADGTMKTGWVASDEKWYFMGGSGIMQENGWVKSNGADYYLKGNGIMATDYIKDGYELDSTGKAIPMTQTKSVELTEDMDLTNETIEGNLYIDAAKFKELELSGITVTGKIVIIGNDIKDSKITIKDSTVNTISTQARNAEIILAGKTVVDSIQMEENATVKPDKDYKGKVATIEIQSTAKDEIKIEVPTKTVSSNTFAPVTINAPIDNLAVNKKTELKVNADVDNITVNKTATDTKVEVEKGSTVGSIASDTKVEVGGPGKVEEVKGEDVVIETPIPDKPAGGGSGGGGGGVTPTPEVVPVANETELRNALNNPDVNKIKLTQNFTLENPITINRDGFELNGDGKTLKMSYDKLTIASKPNSVLIIASDNVKIKNLIVQVSDNTAANWQWNGVYCIQVYEAKNIELEAITLTGGDRGLCVNGAVVTLKGNTTVTGNKKGGIEVSNGQGVSSNAHLTIDSGAEITNGNETIGSPTLYLGATGASLVFGPGKLFQGEVVANEKYFYVNYANSQEKVLNELVTAAIGNLAGNNIAAYSVAQDKNQISAVFNNGTKTINDLMGSGLFAQIAELKKSGVTKIKIGGELVTLDDPTAGLGVIKKAFSAIIGCDESAVLGSQLSEIDGKKLEIVFTYESASTNNTPIDVTYTLEFSVDPTSTLETGGISGSVEEWEPEIEIEL